LNAESKRVFFEIIPMKFHHPIQVQREDIDELGHVNNVVYLRYVQEAATAHWNALVDKELNKQVLWVVLRHEIDYLSPAFEGDELTAITWVGHTQGVKSERHVEIVNARTNKPVIRAQTTWCMLDAGTGKPKRIEEAIIRKLKGG
jgi:acyl-CoA thioester hydrolase